MRRRRQRIERRLPRAVAGAKLSPAWKSQRYCRRIMAGMLKLIAPFGRPWRYADGHQTEKRRVINYHREYKARHGVKWRRRASVKIATCGKCVAGVGGSIKSGGGKRQARVWRRKAKARVYSQRHSCHAVGGRLNVGRIKSSQIAAVGRLSASSLNKCGDKASHQRQ